MTTAITYKQNILAERLQGGQKRQTVIFCQWKNNQNVSTFASGVQPQMYIGNMQTSQIGVCFNNDFFRAWNLAGFMNTHNTGRKDVSANC